VSRPHPVWSCDALPQKKRTMNKCDRRHKGRTNARAMVDKRTQRLTVPTSGGMQFPVIMGAGATSVLLYIASNPGCKLPEISVTLEIGSDRLHIRLHRLKAMGLVIGNRRYQINMAVQFKKQLVRFLRSLGKAHGIPSQSGISLFRGRSANVPIAAPLPEDLFGTAARTRILMMITALGESYHTEILLFTGLNNSSVSNRLADLLNEGALRMRVEKRFKFYSLNPAYPGAADLELLLRSMAMHSPRTCAGANAALVRRYGLGATGGGDSAVLANLDAQARETKHWSTWGVRREIGKRAWKVGHGLADYVVVRK